MKHIIISLLINILVVSCANVNPKVYKDISKDYSVTPTMQPIQVGEKVYEQAKEQARIQEIQHQLYLLNELISESSDSIFVNALIAKYIKLVDELPDIEKNGAYFALAMSKSNYIKNSKK